MLSVAEVYSHFAAALRGTPHRNEDVNRSLHAAATALVASACGSSGDAETRCKAYYKKHPGEFMHLDFCCMIAPSGEMLLAAESELSEQRPEKIMDDFEKLAYLKAPFKVLVFNSQRRDEVLEQAARFLNVYGGHVSGEAYLLIWIGARGPGMEAWAFSVDDDMRLAQQALTSAPA
jgi:hypothetical protein